MADISRVEIYDLLHSQAIVMGKEEEFLAKFGSREDYIKKYGLTLKV
jgi:hypothetical protein